MKILLIYSLNQSNPALVGLVKKMHEQFKAFTSLAKTDLVHMGYEGVYINNLLIKSFPSGRLGYLYGYYWLFFNSIEKMVDLKEYDLIYIRYPLAFPDFVNFLRKASRIKGPKLYLEIPTYPYYNEDFNLKRQLLLFIDRLNFSSVKNYTDKFVSHYRINDRNDMPYYLMGNGAPIVSRINWMPPMSQELHMIGVANVSSYHGFDRVIKGISNYKNYGKAEVYFHVVGDGGNISSLIELAKSLQLEDSIIFHGTKTGKELDELYLTSHVGVSTLGWHRLGVRSDGSLKSREYCMRGLPFITCADDPDLPKDFMGKLNVGLNDDAVNIEKVLDFLLNLPSDISYRMHNYALSNLTWERKIDRFLQNEGFNA